MASAKPAVLMVISSHEPGWYLPELAHPFEILEPSCRITIASYLGSNAPPDPKSVDVFKNDEICARFYETKQELWKNSGKLEDFKGRADEFDVICFIGGYGPMFDVIDSKTAEEVILDFYHQNKLLTGVCHGSAAYAHVKNPSNGKFILDGHKIVGVSNKECELLFPSTGIVEPWSVETELDKATGGKYEKAQNPFEGHVVVSKSADGRTFITGQNPASGLELGKAIYEELFGVSYGA
ncbi:hypothetical protein PV08_09438 [Exophiala spinifera]|uniref:D-lactate dehydratase n=1 Tax=Exophiala spinifera TaxID=91928 RepID=A0A0D2AZL5_9EURO|nr:uncharacterized protein PV08_09438 [Exophiala spinifera]KIW12163.1 hypothetical protein PV08_09438 [Exophiala spinifera]